MSARHKVVEAGFICCRGQDLVIASLLVLMVHLLLTVPITAQVSAEDWIKSYELSVNGSDVPALLAYENATYIDPENVNAWINKAIRRNKPENLSLLGRESK